MNALGIIFLGYVFRLSSQHFLYGEVMLRAHAESGISQ